VCRLKTREEFRSRRRGRKNGVLPGKRNHLNLLHGGGDFSTNKRLNRGEAPEVEKSTNGRGDGGEPTRTEPAGRGLERSTSCTEEGIKRKR